MVLRIVFGSLWNVVEEYVRILLFAIPPTLFFILAVILSNNIPKYFFPPYPPFLVLALLSGCSCFIFAEDRVGGYFESLPTNGDKGFRLMMIKLMEVAAERIATNTFQEYGVSPYFIDNNFNNDHTRRTCLAIYCLSVMTIAGLRSVMIFPFVIFLTKWTTRIPGYWYPLEKE